MDTGHQGQLVRITVTLLILGILPMFMVGRRIFPGAPSLFLLVGSIAGLVLFSCLLWQVILETSHGMIGGLSATSGDPYTMQYSDIETLVIRGNFAEAAVRYREIASTSLTEAPPHIRLGDVLTTHLHDDVGAIAAYQAARTARPTMAEQSQITNALIDLHRKSGNSDALKDELLRFAQLHPNAPAGRAAREEVRRMARGEGGTGET